ncbi:2a protein [Gayfeather mild mottle virus]|uniref:RNA-directed RNA polymerase 2a n=1 Tax=Gayfeather mild mottle virus TaxID=578305 RepID=C0MNB3_9BROM|nr:2a protein [Gayfeather mild mottle virus]CAT02557.1 2a protein [Gayfeather mild mottle virus]
MASTDVIFSLENLLNGSYGVVTPEDDALFRQRSMYDASVSDDSIITDDDDAVAFTCDDVSADGHGESNPSDPCSEDGCQFNDNPVLYDIEEYQALSDSELFALFDTIVKPIKFGSILTPEFSRPRFYTALSLAKSVSVISNRPSTFGEVSPELIKAIYIGEPITSVSGAHAVGDTPDDCEGYVFVPSEPTSNFEPPPICEECGLAAYHCPHFDFNALKETHNDHTISHDYEIETLTGVIDDATLLMNLGPFLVPIQCEYSKTFESKHATKPSLARPTDRVDVDVVQAVCDSMLPTHVNYDDTYHQVFVEDSDYSVDIDRIRLKQSDLLPKVSDDGHMHPVLNTGSGHKRVGTQKEVHTAIKKRNADVPELGDSVNLTRLSEAVAERFISSYMNVNALVSSNFINVVGNFHAYMQKWHSSLSYDDLPDLNAENLQFYEHMVKSDVKPSVTDTLNVDRPVPATITFHKKQITSQFSPLFTALFERFQRCLRSKVVLPVGKISSLELEDFSVIGKHCLEIDLSKFDKSQGELHLMIQEQILNRLGCPAHVSKWWCDFHRQSYIKDKRAGVGMALSFQRRTGDAFTYFGNTLVTMALFCWCYDTEQFDRMLFSGDDSLAFSSIAPVGDPSKFTTLFNMEAKVMEPSVPYICSKFLLTDEFGQTFSVPDPLREIQRLGSKKIPYSDDDSFLHAHFMSFVDRLKFLERMSQFTIDQLTLFYEMKYKKSGADASLVLGAFKKYTTNFNAYKELYFSDRHQCDLINSFSIGDFVIKLYVEKPARR